MSPVLCVVGASGVGKTTLLVRLLEVLGSRGYRVGVVKHTHHQVAVDRGGSDTDRLRKAGAERAVLTGPGFSAVFGDELSFREAVRAAGEGCDLVLVEGFKSAGALQLEVVGEAGPVCQPWLAVGRDADLEELADRIIGELF